MTTALRPTSFGLPQDLTEPVATGVGVGVGNYADRVGDARVDGLIGRNWASNNLTYSDPDSYFDYTDASGNPYPVPVQPLTRLSAAQLEAVKYALDADAPAPGLLRTGKYFSVEAFTQANMTYQPGGTGVAVLRYANSGAVGTATSYMPSPGDVRGGDAFFGGTGQFPAQGTADYHAVLQMVGHTLGLKYAHDSSGWGATASAYDALEYSVMSFRSYVGAAIGEYSNELFSMPQTFMMGDIRALQQQYGADFTTNAGATVYSWDPVTGETWVNGEMALDPFANRVFMTIWDGGGYDTYDMSNYTTNLRIDLTPGGSSTLSSAQLARLGDGHVAQGNVYNALQYNNDPRSLIEAAIGGSGNDTILGNAAANGLEGGDGNDVLSGGQGNDVLDGGRGRDVIYGGPGDDDIRGGNGNDILYGNVGSDTMGGDRGNDTYYVDSRSDFIFEFAGEGTDTVISTVVFNLGDNFENIEYVGSFAGGGSGNALANRMTASDYGSTMSGLGGADTLIGGAGADYLRGGNGADRLIGGAGADVLMGGRGADVFVFERTAHSEGAGADVLRAADGGLAFDGAGSALGDVIDLSAIDANQPLAGNQAFVFGSRATGGIWLENVGGNTVLFANNDRDAAADFRLVIEDGGVLAEAYRASDFIL